MGDLEPERFEQFAMPGLDDEAPTALVVDRLARGRTQQMTGGAPFTDALLFLRGETHHRPQGLDAASGYEGRRQMQRVPGR